MVTWIKRFLVLFPILLGVLFIASFLVVKGGSRERLNQLSIGSIGEPENLNPIIATTTSASEVGQFVFNALLRYDENLDLEGELAREWSITQTSTIFFNTPPQAAAALEKLNASRAKWAKWKLAGAETSGDRLLLHLSEAGTALPEKIQAQFDKSSMQAVNVVRVDTKGVPASFEPGGAVREVWKDGTLGFELVVTGDPQAVLGQIEGKYPNPTKDSHVTPSVIETSKRLDEPEILFHIKDGVQWHDGRPLTAADVEFTHRMLMDEGVASPRRADYELIKRVDVIDPLTVRVVYRRPYSPCLNSWMMPLIPKHLLDGKNSAWWAKNFNRNPVGTGPFKFAEWKVNQYVRLEKNTDYFEGVPSLDAVVIRTIPDPVSIRLSFEAREIDYWGVDPFAVAGFSEDPRFDLYSRLAPSYDYIGWNLEREVFQDLKVRQALAHAVDVPSIIKFIYYGHAEQSRGTFPPMMWFANSGISVFDYNPQEAEKLLDEAGWVRGSDGIRAKDGKKFEFKLITNNANESRKDIATLVQSDLKKIGVSVDVQLFEWAVFISKYINKKDFDATVLGWAMGYDYDQYQIWHSSQTGVGMLNFVGYRNPAVDRLLTMARSEFDREKIKASCWELQQTIYDDQPYLFIDVPESVALILKENFPLQPPEA